MEELRPDRLFRSLFHAALLALLFCSLPVFAAGVPVENLFMKGFFVSLAGYYLMRIVAWKIKNYVLNREEVLVATEVKSDN